METGNRVITPKGDEGRIVGFRRPPVDDPIGGLFVRVRHDRMAYGPFGREVIYSEHRSTAFRVGDGLLWRKHEGVVLV